MLSLEMLGAYDNRPGSQRYPPGLGWFYPDRGDFIAFVSNLASRKVLRRTAAALSLPDGFSAYRSRHARPTRSPGEPTPSSLAAATLHPVIRPSGLVAK